MFLQDDLPDNSLHNRVMFPGAAVALIDHLVVPAPAPQVGVLLHTPPPLPHLHALAVLQLRSGVAHSSGPQEVCELGWKDPGPGQEVWPRVLAPVTTGSVLGPMEMCVLTIL